MIFAKYDIKAILREIGSVARQHRGLGVQRLALQNPASMGPPTAFRGGMRIADMVAVLVMYAMRGYPEHWATFQRRGGKDRHHIFQPLRDSVAAMRQQAVVTHSDADIDRQHIGHDEDRQGAPAKEEEGGNRSSMKDGQKDGGCPGHAVVLRRPSQHWKGWLGMRNRGRFVDRNSNRSSDEGGLGGLDRCGVKGGSLDGVHLDSFIGYGSHAIPQEEE